MKRKAVPVPSSKVSRSHNSIEHGYTEQAEIGEKHGPFDLAMIPIWRGGTLQFIARMGLKVSLLNARRKRLMATVFLCYSLRTIN
jgi:hypothetical protein